MREILASKWSDIGDKIVRLAEEFPAEHWEFKPTPGTRSFAEQVRHVAFWNEYAEASLAGKVADGEANELDAKRYPGKPEILPALRESFAGVARLAGDGLPDDESTLDTLVSFIEHGGEHYGQLVMYYRLNGLVPPASRG
jgi:hypothetical protein